MKHSTLSVIACLWALTAPTVRADDYKPEQLYKRLLPSVMTLTVQNKDGSADRGTGFLSVKDGLAVTAWHVVHDAKSVTAKFSDGEEFEVTGLVDRDEKRDVALVRVKEFGRPLLALAASAPEVGCKAYAVGAPEGLEFSLSDGLISQIQKDGGVTLYQFSCPVSPGNSGGPLAEANGDVIGVVSRQMKDGQNLNFAMPAAYALALDSTLPTRTWQDVKPEGAQVAAMPQEPARAAVADNGALDRRLADTFITLSDTLTALQATDGLLRKDGGAGFTAGVPPFLYTLQRALTSEAIDLPALPPADPGREKARAEVEGRVGAALDSVDLLVQAVRAAQGESGWYGLPNDLLAQSVARLPEFAAPYDAGVKSLVQSAGFEAVVPKVGVLGLPEDTTGFRLGAVSWVRSPLDLVWVTKDTLADKMGLRAGDTLLSVGDQVPKSLLDLKLDFKAAIKTNAGGRLKLVVLRDGKRKEWEAHIPRELPQE